MSRLAKLFPARIATCSSLTAPEHTWIRRILLGAVSPAAVTKALPRIEELCQEIISEFESRGNADLATEWAIPIPSTVITYMLGIPREDWPRFKDWTTQGVDHLAENKSQYGEPNAEFREYLHHQVDIRRALDDPPDDILSRMIQHRGELGEELSDHQIVVQTEFIIQAGNETTTNLLSNLMYEVLSRPGLYDRMRDDVSIIPKAIEETLRYNPPIQFFPRLCVEDTEIRGVPINADEPVVLSLASGNRDEAAFGPDSEQFEIDREPSARHLTFGVGRHLCVGASLAREQARLAIETLVNRIPAMQIEPGYEYEKADFHMMRGAKRLPVIFDPA